MAHDHGDDADRQAAPARPFAGRPSGRSLDAATRDRIGRGLKRYYARVLALPIPDHLRALLDELAVRAERESSR